MSRKPFYLDSAEQVGQRVRAVRLTRGLTVADMCRIGKLQPSQGYAIEGGRCAVGKVTAAKLSTALGVDVGEFGRLADSGSATNTAACETATVTATPTARPAAPESGSLTPAVFVYNEMSIRTTVYQGQRMAVAADICKVLELNNTSQAVSRLENEDVVTIRRSDTLCSNDEANSFWSQFPNGTNWITLVTEGGSTDLILDSRKPEARKFRRWLTHEVWPSIRDTGSYTAPSAAKQPPGTYTKTGDPETDLNLLRDAVESLIVARRDAREAAELARRTEARLDAVEGKHDWFSALAYARLNNLPTGSQWLAGFGRMATTVARGYGIAPEKTQHAHFGTVNSYPEWVWTEALPKWQAANAA